MLEHDIEWHKQHKALGFADPIADLVELLEESKEDNGERMSDLISRQAAIDAINNNAPKYTEAKALWKSGYLIGLSEADKLVVSLPSAQPEPQWTPCSERLPERIINGDVETEQEFFVTVKERWPGEEWTYDTDLAWVPGEYIDDYWQTFNDWKEGQEVHVIAWMPLPEPWRGEEP